MRLSVALLLAFMFLNAGAGFVQWTTGGDLGAEPETGDPANLEGLDPDGANSSETTDKKLTGIRLALASQFGGFVSDIFPALDMLDAVGIPDDVIAFVFAPLSLYTTLDLIGFLRNGALLQQ